MSVPRGMALIPGDRRQGRWLAKAAQGPYLYEETQESVSTAAPRHLVRHLPSPPKFVLFSSNSHDGGMLALLGDIGSPSAGGLPSLRKAVCMGDTLPE